MFGKMPWELWSNDYFDRDARPCLEAEGRDLLAGIRELWRMTLRKGLMADGRPTFTWFQLRWPGGGLSLPRDPFDNPELAKLKVWETNADLMAMLAQTLASRPVDRRCSEILELIGKANDPQALCLSLMALD